MSGNELNEVTELLASIVRAIVDQPELVRVRVLEGSQSVVLELTVASSDVGKVIGKRGIHADAIRRIIHAVGGKHKRRYLVEISGEGGVAAAE